METLNNLNITPHRDKIWMELITMNAGGLDVSGYNLVSEKGRIVAIGEGVVGFDIEDIVYVKAWGIDHVQIDGKDYYVVDISSKAILGKEKR